MLRRKAIRPKKDRGEISLKDLGYKRKYFRLARSTSIVSLADELRAVSLTDEFQQEVAKTSSSLLIGRQEAETEVFTDILIQENGNVDKALLTVMSMDMLESKILVLVNNLINRGADTSTNDEKVKTPLHVAAKKNWKVIATKLLENNANAHKRDKSGTLPLHIAIDNRHDDMAALLLAYMHNNFVRRLFLAKGYTPAELSFQVLIKSEMQKTILSVLDCMMETQGSSDAVRVYYNVLDCDESGFAPTHNSFNYRQKSPLQVIAKQGHKTTVYHDAVRLLVRRKWKAYAGYKFQIDSLIYILGLIALSFSVIVAVRADDPARYDSVLHIARAVTEVSSLCMVITTLLSELNQLRRHKLEYFMDHFNWIDMLSSVLLVVVPALRFTGNSAQWHVYAFGYLFWVIRVFEFAAVFRQTGNYAQILGRVIANDFLHFGLLLMVVLLAFSGSFFLSLRGDDNLHVHNETSTFWGILFVGVRTLTEQPVVEYAGSDGYSTLSTIILVVFQFACCVILLNILIAQLSDTYQKVQQDAQRALEVNMAWIVARVELNSFFFRQRFRTSHYTEHEDIPDLRTVLTKWDSPPLNEMNKYVRDIWDSLDNQKMNLMTIQHRMVRQENALRNIQKQLNILVSSHQGTRPAAGHSEPTIPTVYRSISEYNLEQKLNVLPEEDDVDVDVEDNVTSYDVTLGDNEDGGQELFERGNTEQSACYTERL